MLTLHLHAERLSAQRLLLLSWMIWLLLYLVLPVNPIFEGNTGSVCLLVGSNIALLAGLSASVLIAPRSEGRSVVLDERAVARLRRLLAIIIACGLVSFVIRPIDYFVVRGVSLDAGVIEARDALELSGASWLSIPYTLLTPAAVAAGVLCTALAMHGMRGKIIIWGILSFLGVPIFSILLGSRSTLILIAAMLVVTAVIAASRLKPWMFVVVIISIIPIYLVTMALFLVRLDEMGIQLGVSARNSGFTSLVPTTNSALAVIDTAPDWLSRVVFYSISVGQYYIHGVFEFFLLVDLKSHSGDPLLWGQYDFAIVNQFLKLIKGANQVIDLADFDPLSGVFTTFWGPAFIDFGYTLTPVFSFLVGLSVDYFRRQVSAGNIFALPLYCLFLVQVFLMPVSSFFASGVLYYNVGLFLVWMLSMFWSCGHRIAQLPGAVDSGNRPGLVGGEARYVL